MVCANSIGRPLDIPYINNNPNVFTVTALTEKKWETNVITTQIKKPLYSFPVSAGGKYYIWWSGRYKGNETSLLTAETVVYVYGSDGLPIFNGYWEDNPPYSITVDSGDKVYLMVDKYRDEGTYAIAYSDVETRPAYTMDGVPLFTPKHLTENTWENGELIASSDIKWYSVDVTSGTKYWFWKNEKEERPENPYPGGDGTKTGIIDVIGFNSNGTRIMFFSVNNYSSLPENIKSYTPTENDTVYIQVKPYYTTSRDSFGTYGIVYSTGSNKPEQE